MDEATTAQIIASGILNRDARVDHLRSCGNADLGKLQGQQLAHAHRMLSDRIEREKDRAPRNQYLTEMYNEMLHSVRTAIAEYELTAGLKETLMEQEQHQFDECTEITKLRTAIYASFMWMASQEVERDFVIDLLGRLLSAKRAMEFAESRLAFRYEESILDEDMSNFIQEQKEKNERYLLTEDQWWPRPIPHSRACLTERSWLDIERSWRECLAKLRATHLQLYQTHLMSRIEQLEQLVSNRYQAQRTYTASEPFIEAQLNENDVSAFPDTGAAANFMSLQYVKDHGLRLDQASSRLVKLGNGSTVNILGTTTSRFSFAGEKATHTLLFNVLRTSVYDVVLGSPFLKATETLTRYAHRIGRRCREALSYRVCALGATQRVSGRLNGVQVNAVPDTGAEVSLMSASFAAQQGFEINTDAHHCVLLAFADGSTANATGLVKFLEWTYGDTGSPYRINVYVLPELSVDLLLGYDFLHDTNAFIAHEADFWSGDDAETLDMAAEEAIVWFFWIIKLVRKAVKDQRDWGSQNQNLLTRSSLEERWQAKKCEELKAYRIAKAESELLPEAQRSQFMEPRIARWQKVLETHPSHASVTLNASSAASSSSSTGAILPPPAGPVQIAASVAPVNLPKSTSKFRVGWLKDNFKKPSPRN